MFKRRVIVTASLVIALIIGVVIDHFTGFDKGYFAISVAILLSGYYIVEFLIDIISYSYLYDDEFKIFVAEKVNKTSLSYDEVMQNKKYYLKEFKRSRRKGKFAYWIRLTFAMGLFIFLIVCLFLP